MLAGLRVILDCDDGWDVEEENLYLLHNIRLLRSRLLRLLISSWVVGSKQIQSLQISIRHFCCCVYSRPSHAALRPRTLVPLEVD